LIAMPAELAAHAQDPRPATRGCIIAALARRPAAGLPSSGGDQAESILRVRRNEVAHRSRRRGFKRIWRCRPPAAFNQRHAGPAMLGRPLEAFVAFSTVGDAERLVHRARSQISGRASQTSLPAIDFPPGGLFGCSPCIACGICFP
jgi:hypothetical protein